ncbi:hypothetical protein FC698_15750 [Bacillus cereus]|uniref:hypothetical protein n=1 Tax=Bacillus cereus TaxID=1396 RepID=UPI0010BE7C1B|nr:hypothetical protein [Bacillus cereus]TKH47374.1 hypothetical protein FC698_15750 [Bacillus cereus]
MTEEKIEGIGEAIRDFLNLEEIKFVKVVLGNLYFTGTSTNNQSFQLRYNYGKVFYKHGDAWRQVVGLKIGI